jgi:O-antigen/teichoic acid export membrane protein
MTLSYPDLKRHTLAYGLAVFADRMTSFLLLPMLTAGFSREDFGIWSQVLTTYGLMSHLLLFGFFHTVSGLVAGKQPDEAARIYGGILAIVLIDCLLFAGLILVAPAELARAMFGSGNYGSLIIYVACYFVTECMYELIVLAFLRAKGQILRCAGFHGGKSLLRLPLVFLGLMLPEPLAVVLALLSLGNLTIAVYVFVKHVRAGRPTYPLPTGFWVRAIGKSAAVTGVLVLAWAIASSNRYLLVHFLSLEQLAVYSLNYSILSISSLVPMVIGFTMLHHVSHLRALGQDGEAAAALNESVALYLYAALPLLALTGLFYQALMGFLANPEYGVGVGLLGALLCYFFVFGLEQILVFATFAGDYSSALLVRLFALVLSLGAGVVLIPNYGIEAAAWPALMASGAIVIWCSVSLGRSMHYRFPWKVLRSVGPAWIVLVLVGIVWIKIWPEGSFHWKAPLGALLLATLYLLLENLSSGSMTRGLYLSMRGRCGKGT